MFSLQWNHKERDEDVFIWDSDKKSRIPRLWRFICMGKIFRRESATPILTSYPISGGSIVWNYKFAPLFHPVYTAVCWVPYHCTINI